MTQAYDCAQDLLASFERLHPKAIELSLDRILRLLAALGHPERSLPPVVHVAGTNGKGSVVAYLKAMFEAAGRGAHVFTSPHLRRFNERIALAGPGGATPIGDDALCEALLRAEKANQGQPITFFEITTAAAFLAFAESPADVLLLETGLGGRLDATNVIERPALTIITPVSLDHCGFLGDALEAIAGEKAGILKRGVACVVAPQKEPAMRTILRRAARLMAPVRAAGQDWDAYEQHGRLVYQDEQGLLDLPLPRLPGRHQIDNAGTATAAARELERFGLRDEHIARGLTTAQWPARLERLGPGALYAHVIPGSEIWLDGGHNPAAGEALAQAMADFEERAPSPLHVICGMMSTKDAEGFLGPFQGLAEFVATVGIPGQANAFSAEDLAETARRCGLCAEPAESLTDALTLSRAVGERPVRILITGSLYLAGRVLEMHEQGAGRS